MVGETVSEDKQTIPVYVDFTSSHAGHPESKEIASSSHRQWLESNLDAIISRQGSLPILMVHNDSPAVRLVVDLLLEARNLFYLGFHYSCVAMCGIVAERIVKDVFRRNVVTLDKEFVQRPTDKAFDQLERIDIRSLINFAAECSLISNEVKSAATKLGDLRNQYAHARGQNSEADALKAIEHLHSIVEGTISVLKDFEVKDGQLVPRHLTKENGGKAN